MGGHARSSDNLGVRKKIDRSVTGHACQNVDVGASELIV